MRCAAFFLLLLTLATSCVLEDKPIDAGADASPDSGECGGCFDPEPVCVEGIGCVQCTAEDDAYCTEQMLVCKTDEMKCVGCLGSSDCNDASLAHCNTDSNECEECETNTDCEGIEGLSVCDAGECVQCTPGTEADECGDKSCDPATRTCTTTVIGSQGVCEICVADSECGDNGTPSTSHRCVAMEYQGEPFPADGTGFCLKSTDGGCEQPYSITLSDRTSLSGLPLDDYCGINEHLATCPAVRALVQNQSCPGGNADACPQPSGLCEQVGNLQNRCTYPCASVVECLENIPDGRPGSTCGSSGSGGDDYCGG